MTMPASTPAAITARLLELGDAMAFAQECVWPTAETLEWRDLREQLLEAQEYVPPSDANNPPNGSPS